MPKIRVFETDNTGSSPVEDLAVVFVAGEIAIALDKNDVSKEDANHCIYIPSTATVLSDYLEDVDFDSKYESAYEAIKAKPSKLTNAGGLFMDTAHLIQTLIGLGYGVIYMDASSYSCTEYSYTQSGVNEVDFPTPNTSYYKLNEDGVTYELATEYTVPLFVRNEVATYTGIDAMAYIDGAFDFLNDKNAYDIKFITFGNYCAVKASLNSSVATGQGTTKFGFDFRLLNNVLPVCGERKDCSVLVDVNYYNTVTTSSGDVPEDIAGTSMATFTEGNAFVTDFKTAVECSGDGIADNYKLAKFVSGEGTSQIDVSSRAYALLPNATFAYSVGSAQYTLIVPSSLIYLNQYSQSNSRTRTWLPITGVNRGVVEGTFTPDLSISKYLMDNSIIEDGEGVSFNAVVTVRPYGYTIWGDRTLIQQDAVKKVQATSYFSLRNLVSDIAKTAYNSAIRYTYETNNDITWFNFKQDITTLLDQVVSSGVLQSYTVKRGTTDSRNTMVAIITLYPVLPVENFDIAINLENAEVITTSDDTTI